MGHAYAKGPITTRIRSADGEITVAEPLQCCDTADEQIDQEVPTTIGAMEGPAQQHRSHRSKSHVQLRSRLKSAKKTFSTTKKKMPKVYIKFLLDDRAVKLYTGLPSKSAFWSQQRY